MRGHQFKIILMSAAFAAIGGLSSCKGSIRGGEMKAVLSATGGSLIYSASTNPSISGSVQLSRNETPSDIRLYSEPGCVSILASGAYHDFIGSGIAVSVPSNAQTSIYGKVFRATGSPLSECVFLTQVVHDSIPATVAVTSPAGGSYVLASNASAFAVSGTCSENGRAVLITGSGTATATCTSGTWSANVNFGAASDGAIAISVSHSDAAGNAATPATLALTKDATAPTVSISSPAANTLVDGDNQASFTVTGSCSENTRNVVISGAASATVSCSGGSWSSNLDFTAASAGTVSISVAHSDAAGNVATAATRNFNKDLTVPILSTKNISGTASSTQTIVFSGAAHGDLQLRFRDRYSNLIVHSSSVASNGNVTLPARAGLYWTELRHTNGKLSYGQATVTTGVAGFSFVHKVTPTNYSPYAQFADTNKAIGDYNGDGYLDYAIGAGRGATYTLTNPGIMLYRFNSGTGQFVYDTQLVTSANFIHGMRFADLDGDADLDLVYSQHDPNLYYSAICWMLNTSGTFGTQNCVADTGISTNWFHPYDMEVADLDRDGDLDVILSGGTRSTVAWLTRAIKIFRNNGSSNFTQTETLSFATPNFLYHNVKVGDLNNDGRLDIFAPAWMTPAVLDVFIQTTSNTFSTSSIQSTSIANASLVQVGYLNGDGKIDAITLLSADPTARLLLSNTSDNTYAVTTITTPSEQTGGCPQVLDLNQDGVMEAHFGSRYRLGYNSRVGSWYKTTANFGSAITVGAGNSFSGNTTAGVSSTEVTSDFADFNNDGYLDLVLHSGFSAPYFEYLRGQ